MAGKNKQKPQDQNQSFEGSQGSWSWRPRKRQKNDASRQRLPYYDPLLGLPKITRPTDQAIVELLADMGEEFVLKRNQRDQLSKELVSCIRAAKIMSARRKTSHGHPPDHELAERHDCIAEAAERLYRLFEMRKPIESAFATGVETNALHPLVYQDLFKAAMENAGYRPPYRYDEAEQLIKHHEVADNVEEFIAQTLTGVAKLHVLAKFAADSYAAPKVKHPSESEFHSVLMARLYRFRLGKEPKKTSGGPWVKFLAWSRRLACLPALSHDRLRRLPTQPSPDDLVPSHTAPSRRVGLKLPPF